MGYLSREELGALRFAELGDNVMISRDARLYRPERMRIGSNVRIDDFCIVSGSVTFGSYIQISVYCYVFGDVAGITFGDFSALAHGVKVFTASDDYSGRSLTNPTVPDDFKPGKVSAPVSIGRHAIIGAGSVILPGADVAEGTAVGALSLVAEPTEPWRIYVGCPARPIRHRERDALELEERFLNLRAKGA